MPNTNANSAGAALRGADLELWRLENKLSKSAAADAFGLRPSTFDELVQRSQEVISDPTVAMLLYLYRTYPGASPVEQPLSVNEFYDFLDFQESPRDRENFAILIGRSKQSVYRLLTDNGTPGRPVVRWIEAVRRMQLTSRQSRMLMSDVVSKVGELQGLENVLVRGWQRAAVPEGE